MIPLDGHFVSVTTLVPFAVMAFILFSYWRFKRAVKVRFSRFSERLWLTRKFCVAALSDPRRWSPTFRGSAFLFHPCQLSDFSSPLYPTRYGRIPDLPFLRDSSTRVFSKSSNATPSHFVHGTVERCCTLATFPSSPASARMHLARCSRSQSKSIPSSATLATTW